MVTEVCLMKSGARPVDARPRICLVRELRHSVTLKCRKCSRNRSSRCYREPVGVRSVLKPRATLAIALATYTGMRPTDIHVDSFGGEF